LGGPYEQSSSEGADAVVGCMQVLLILAMALGLHMLVKSFSYDLMIILLVAGTKRLFSVALH